MIDIGDDHDIATTDASANASFVNADWEVSEDGLEHRATGYFIGRDALASRRQDGLWSWPLHLSEKSWCTPRLFREAFMAAVERFGIARDPLLTQSFAMAFGLRPGSAGGSKDTGFVALGELVRPRSVARKRPVVGGVPVMPRYRTETASSVKAAARL